MKIKLQKTKHIQINEMIEKFERDDRNYFRQAHRMIDLFETIIKTHTTILLANYFKINKISDEVAKRLVQGMVTPSLGTWLGFNEVLFEDLAFNNIPKNVYEAIFKSLQQQDQEKMERIYEKEGSIYVFRSREQLNKVSQRGRFLDRIFSAYKRQRSEADRPFTNLLLPSFYTNYRNWHNRIGNKVVHFRNEYAHGATPPEDGCRQDIEQNIQKLKQSLTLPWLHDTSVVVFNEDLQTLAVGATWNKIEKLRINESLEPHIPYLVLPNKELLQLFPTVTYQPITQENTQSVSFFNDLKHMNRQQISYLNYPYAKHIQDDDVYDRFLEVFRLEEWRQNLLTEFEDLMLRMKEGFKGRVDELAYIQTFVERHNRGFLYLYGTPGIGKSALVANALNEPSKDYTVIKYFVRNRKYTHISEVLDYLNRTIDQTYRQQLQLTFGFGDTVEEKRKLLLERLQHITPHLVNNGEKLIIMIDGLDEGDQTLLNNLIFETFANVLIIYVGRQTPEVRAFINDLPLDYLTKKEIGKIKTKDIRAMLYEVVNKYELTESYVQAIAKKSGGHPLYIRLLCDVLIERPEKLNDAHYLPEKWEEFYQRLIDQFIDDEHGQHILEGLFVFAAAKDFLSKDQMRLILNNNAQQNLIIFNHLSELLVEHVYNCQHYQLFHETFHEYLVNNHAFDVMDAEEKLVQYCLRWEDLSRFGEQVLHYPLNHLSSHLQDRNDLSQLQQLVQNDRFKNKQIEVTGKFTASFMLLEAYRSVAYEQNNRRGLIDAMTQTVHLNKKLRSKDMLLQQIGTEMSFPEWQEKQKNLYFYNDAEKSRIYFIDLWNSLSLEETLLERMIHEIDQQLPMDPNLFNWAAYVPLPLLIEISMQLHKRQIDYSFILNRVHLHVAEMTQTLPTLSLRDSSAQVVKQFIDLVQIDLDGDWFALMRLFIEQLFKKDLAHLVAFYEKAYLAELPASDEQVFWNYHRRKLAMTYLKAGWITKAFELVENIFYGPIKEAAYRQIYETYQQIDEAIAEKAYEKGSAYLQEYSYDDRLEVLAKWLSILHDKGPRHRYETYLSELETALADRSIKNRYLLIELMEKHYLYSEQYDKVLYYINKIDHRKEYQYKIILELVNQSKQQNCPEHIQQKITEKYKEMVHYFVEKQLYNERFYATELSAIVQDWIVAGEGHKVKRMIPKIVDVANREQALIDSLKQYIKIDDQEAILQTALQVEEHRKQVIDLLFENDLIEQLCTYIEKTTSEKVQEELYYYSAKQALEANDEKLFKQLAKRVTILHNRKQLTFREIFAESIHSSYEVALQLMNQSLEQPSPMASIQEETSLALAQRFLHEGNVREAYELLEALPFEVTPAKLVEQAIEFHLYRQQFTEALTLFDYELADPSFLEDPFSYKAYSDVTVNTLIEMIIQMSRQGDPRVVSLLESFYEKTNIYPNSLFPYFAAIEQLEKIGITKYTAKILQLCENLIAQYSVENTEITIALYPTVANQCDLSHFYYENGYKMKARYHLQHLIQFFSKERNFDRTNIMLSYVRIAYECRRQGLLEEFKYFSEQYKYLYDPSVHDSLWKAMSSIHIREGDVEEAVKAIEKLTLDSEVQYLSLMNHLLIADEIDEALEVYEILKSDSSEVENKYVLEAQALVVTYYFRTGQIEKGLQKIQANQIANHRRALYKNILPLITKGNLAVFLHYLSEEPSDVKQSLEREILLYALTEPAFKEAQLLEIFANLSMDQTTTVLALYIYRMFKEHHFDEQIEQSIVTLIDEAIF